MTYYVDAKNQDVETAVQVLKTEVTNELNSLVCYQNIIKVLFMS